MSGSGAPLKNASGWFAAGVEVQRAATLLSDAAFKLFVWMCLHADRRSGILPAAANDLARALGKTGEEVHSCLEELVRAGICRPREPGEVEIRDAFWPYERALPATQGNDPDAYVAAVRQIFLGQGCVRSSFSPADGRLAAEWNRKGVPVERVERAILLGTLRKYVALINNGGGTPITTLHYFRHLVDEVEQIQISPDYWRYVAFRVADFERRWRAITPRPDRPTDQPEDTKYTK
jgi:hypothetical protein